MNRRSKRLEEKKQQLAQSSANTVQRHIKGYLIRKELKEKDQVFRGIENRTLSIPHIDCEEDLVIIEKDPVDLDHLIEESDPQNIVLLGSEQRIEMDFSDGISKYMMNCDARQKEKNSANRNT